MGVPQLHETYHGVYINIQYTLVVDVIMGALKQNMKKSIEFIVEAPVPEPATPASRLIMCLRKAKVFLSTQLSSILYPHRWNVCTRFAPPARIS